MDTCLHDTFNEFGGPGMELNVAAFDLRTPVGLGGIGKNGPELRLVDKALVAKGKQ